MGRQWLTGCLRFVATFAALESALCLKLSVPSTPTFLDQNMNLTWVLSPGDPPVFNVNAICNNITVPLRSSVRGGDKHVSIAFNQLPPAARFPYGSCVLRATDTSNKTTLASSSSFVVLSVDLPVSSSSPSPSPTPTPTPTTPMKIGPPTLVSTSTTSTSQTIASPSEPLSGSQDGTSTSTSTPSQVSVQSAFSDVQTAQAPSGSPIQATAFAVTTTDFLGDVLTLTFKPAAFPTSNDGLVPVSSGATLFAVTTTVTYVTHSSTNVVTLTFTTDLPISPTNSSPPLSTSTANRTRVASIVGGTLGSVVIIALLFYGYIVRARHRRPVPPVLEPLVYEPNYTQPPEKSVRPIRDTPRPNMVTQHGITSSTQLNVERVHREYVSPLADDLEALKQDAIHATRLRVQVQRMSERILELEDHQRELEIYASQWSHPFAEVTNPPDYMDTDSFTYSERLTHT